jgi:hypothetical protein
MNLEHVLRHIDTDPHHLHRFLLSAELPARTHTVKLSITHIFRRGEDGLRGRD